MEGVQPDLLVLRPDGKRLVVQACCKNKASYEAEVFMKLSELIRLDSENPERVDFILGVAVNKGHKSALERAILKISESKIPEKLVLLDFDTIVDPGFDWSGILEDVG